MNEKKVCKNVIISKDKTKLFAATKFFTTFNISIFFVSFFLLSLSLSFSNVRSTEGNETNEILSCHQQEIGKSYAKVKQIYKKFPKQYLYENCKTISVFKSGK